MRGESELIARAIPGRKELLTLMTRPSRYTLTSGGNLRRVIGHVVPEQFAGERAVSQGPHVALPRKQFRLAVSVDIEELHSVHVVVIVVEDRVVVPDLPALGVEA